MRVLLGSLISGKLCAGLFIEQQSIWHSASGRALKAAHYLAFWLLIGSLSRFDYSLIFRFTVVQGGKNTDGTSVERLISKCNEDKSGVTDDGSRVIEDETKTSPSLLSSLACKSNLHLILIQAGKKSDFNSDQFKSCSSKFQVSSNEAEVRQSWRQNESDLLKASLNQVSGPTEVFSQQVRVKVQVLSKQVTSCFEANPNQSKQVQGEVSIFPHKPRPRHKSIQSKSTVTSC